MDKARTLDADVIILDLEDAVAPDMKDAAREAAVAAVKAGGFGPREIVIRTNGLDTPWGEADLKAVAEAGPDAVLVPKVNDAADVYAYQAALHAAPVHTRLWTMIETCKAAFHLWEIAAASRTTRLSGWVMGSTTWPRRCALARRPTARPSCRSCRCRWPPPGPTA